MFLHKEKKVYFCGHATATVHIYNPHNQTSMPTTKFSFKRYRILDRCFRNPIKRYQIKDLIDACNKELRDDEQSVSRRTIYYDIAFMKSLEGWDAPIETINDGNRHYYRYSDPDFSIDKVPLSEAQFKKLQSAIDVINLFDGLPHFNGFEDSFAKLGLMSLNTSSKPCFSLDHNDFVGGLQHLTPIFNAIQYETVLHIKYQAFGSMPKEFIFHPQFLKQYNNRWYALGVEDQHQDQIWNMALDRIQSIKPLKTTYIKLKMDWNEYFEDVIGITNIKDAPIEKVMFLVHGATAHYIISKPLHGSQVSKWLDEDTLQVTLSIKINYELKRLLLSYSPNITILAPQSLIQEHTQSLEKALTQYHLK